jgi:hypothetical protein
LKKWFQEWTSVHFLYLYYLYMRSNNLIFACSILLIFTSLSTPDQSGDTPLIRNQTRTDELIVEPPTLGCAGFEWVIYGDENRNAEVQVSFRK